MKRFLSFWRGAGGWKSLFGGTSARARGAVALICGLSCALMVPQILHFTTRDQIERADPKTLPLWNALERIEYSLLDRRLAARGVQKPRCLDSIAIIGIDQTSLSNLNQWPWPRRTHARLVKRLHQAGARVIGLDIGFDNYSNPTFNPRTKERQLGRDDQDLADAIQRAGNVVLVSFLDVTSTSKGITSRLGPPIDELDVATPDLALAYVKRDLDGLVRSSPLYIKQPPETAPLGGFAPLCVAMFQGLVKGEDLGRYQATLSAGAWRDASGIRRDLPLTRASFPGGSAADRTQVWTTPLHFWGPQNTFKTYSYSEVLERSSDPQLKKQFGNRIVLVGATTHILKDTFSIPTFGSSDTGELPGVEIHATMAAMLLDGTYLQTQSRASTLWTLLGLTLVASAWTTWLCRRTSRVARLAQAWWTAHKLPGRIYSALWIGLCAGFGPLPILLFWSAASWAFSKHNWWIIVTYPALGAALSSGAALLLLFVSESSERRKVTTQMARLVAPDVMDEILAHPEEDYPRPRRVHATVLFTDLEGFTSYSEAREPEEVVAALNAYFARMRPIVHAHGGSVDKFIGDSVMVFFGAPVPRHNHAAQALRCAIAMQDECARFRASTGVPFWMRVGVHTGDLIVGSVGSDEQLNYTAIGDTVNLASRLEATNKAFGSRIICSADTHREAPDVAYVEASHTPIRGKSGDVKILIVRGDWGQPPRDAEWGHGDFEINWETAGNQAHLEVEAETQAPHEAKII